MNKSTLNLTVKELEINGWLIQSDVKLDANDKVLEVARKNNLSVVTDETAKEGEVDIFIVSPEEASEMDKNYSGYFVWN